MTERPWLRLAPLVVAGVTFVAFVPALQGAFLNWDDGANFVGNPAYRGLGWPQIRWMFTTTLLGHWMPLTWLSLGLNYVLGGMDPWGYHLGNLLLHAASAALLYLVALRLLAAGAGPSGGGRSDGGDARLACGAAAAALVFGVHPLRVESVAWITERRDVLSGLFYLAAVLAYLWSVEPAGPRGAWRLASLCAFGAALLSKAMVLTLPLTLLIIDTYPLRRWTLGRRAVLLEKVPYLAMAALAAGIALVAQDRGSGLRSYAEYGFAPRLAIVGYSFWFHPRKLAWPQDLSPLYELPARVDVSEWRFAGSILAVSIATIALVWLRRRFPAGLAAWMHSLLVLAPVSGIVHGGNQLAHDRYSYLSGLGFAVLAGAGLVWVLEAAARGRVRRWAGGLVLATAALATLGWSAATWRYSWAWTTSERLWAAATDVDPACAICRNNLGAALVRAEGSDLAQAEAEFRMAIRLRPDRLDPYVNLGALLASRGRLAEAEVVFQAIARSFPTSPEGPTRLGMVYVDQGRHAEALPLLRRALSLAPGFPLARAEMPRALEGAGARALREGRHEEAARIFLELTEWQPNRLEPLRDLGRALVEMGRARDAVAPLRRAITVAPRDAGARFWLARAYVLTGERALAATEIGVLRELDAGLAARAAAGT